MNLRRSLVALTLVTLVGVGGCSDDRDHGGSMMTGQTSSPGSSAGAVSAADVRFMRDMVPMNRQAVRMSHMAATAGASPRTQALARRIRASQLGQMRSIETRLDGWKGMSGMPMMHGTAPLPMGSGMMSGARMGLLSRLHGAPFDARFLSMMTAHHRAAVAAAEREIAHGSDPAARDLAEKMAGRQRAELDMMERIAGRWR
jgi:uncharacterized protein (DUF305 family)